MSTKKFNADLRAAASLADQGTFKDVSSIARGESDGELVMTFHHSALSSPIRIRALAQNLHQYPDGNGFMLFTDSQDAPSTVLQVLENPQKFSSGVKVADLVVNTSRSLTAELDAKLPQQDKGGDVLMTDVEEAESEDSDDEGVDTDVDDDSDDFDSYPFFFGALPREDSASQSASTIPSTEWETLLRRLKHDLRTTWVFGYKVGIIHGVRSLCDCNILSISVRVHKIGLSEEAMQAWNVEPSDYIVLLIRYPGPYMPMDKVVALPPATVKLEFRLGKCKRYKPSLAQASAAFSSAQQASSTADAASAPQESPGGFKKLFVSNSLDQFMKESLVSMVKLRVRHRLSWDEANEHQIHSIGLAVATDVGPSPAPLPLRPVENDPPSRPGSSQWAAPFLNSDHLREDRDPSFPLVAMQFAMRYFVRCTEFCLRCHRRVGKGFDALKPYVCSNPLCLFQYLALGFGPNIEHEILNQPFVVDLLVSFCYASIQSNSGAGALWTHPIREFPVGLRLKVPNMTSTQSMRPIRASMLPSYTSLAVTWPEDLPRLKLNQWVAIRAVTVAAPTAVPGRQVLSVAAGVFLPAAHGITPGNPAPRPAVHARVVALDIARRAIDIDNLSSGGLHGAASVLSAQAVTTPRQRFLETIGNTIEVEILPYEIDFDGLADTYKAYAMLDVLNALPPILDIRSELVKDPHKSLRHVAGVSPAAEALLRWIVSSNRSCIFQIGEHAQDESSGGEGTSENGATKKTRVHDMVPGMDGMVQFRFVQGAPDREQRFRQAVQEMTACKNLQHPTIFAWHGSSLANWHSILRNGLDFADTRNGRAYGNGVYFSPHHSTSQTYSQSAGHPWPNSAILIQSAMSLNEIVNAPGDFVSRSPHYVVSQPDWHQCRYLFVQPQRVTPVLATSNLLDNAARGVADTVKMLVQDPAHPVMGPTNQALKIPLAASPSSRLLDQASGTATSGTASATAASTGQVGTPNGEADYDSEPDTKDVDFFFSAPDEREPSPPPKELEPNGFDPYAYNDSDGEDEEDEIDDPALTGKTGIGRLRAVSNLDSAARPPTPATLDIQGTDFRPGTLDLGSLPRLQPPASGGGTALKALSREVKKLQVVQNKTPLHALGWYIDFEKMANLFQWIVELHSFDAGLPLAADMRSAGITSIVLEVRFGVDFPITPPFVRVVRPRFLPFIEGGGGHITAGGAMCMELLTNSGWSPVNSIESVIIQVRMAMTSLEPRPARLERVARGHKHGTTQDYGIYEAIEAYERAARAHGWAIPAGLRTALGSE